MLRELHVENLLLIERAHLELAPGLNVLTGETGAGKTVLAHALDLLLGGRPRRGIVRPGAREAYVEGCFEVGARFFERLPDGCALDEEFPAGELVLARKVGADGRTRAYLNGRGATVADLRAVAGELVAFYGQHEHRKLMLSAMQLEVLDELCGGEHLERRRVFARTLAEVRALETERERLGELGAARERELELLQYELDQIEQAAPVAGEHEQLVSTRARLRNLDALQSALVHAAHALAPDGAEVPGAAQLAAEAAASIEGVAGLAPGLGELAARCDGLAIEARDVACELEAQRERIESDGSDLHTVEERLAALERLMRRHGGTIESVLEHAGRARGRRDELLDADSALERVSERLREAAARMDEQCAQLRDARARAAGPLAAAVRDQLAALGMADASFEVALSPCGPSSSGADAVEFVLAPNPGVGAGPLREIASGGELSRVMLAIAAVCAGAGTPATKQRGKPGEPDREAAAPAILVFDEVDAGVGGQTGRAVGERLRAIAAWRQVLCITHLPQVASLAQRHFSIAKDTSVSPASATVLELSEQEAVAELARMLGAAEGDPVALRHAHELRQAA